MLFVTESYRDCVGSMRILFLVITCCLDLAVLLAGQGSKAATVSFVPPEGILYVGSKDVITCVVADNKSDSGNFSLKAEPNNEKLLSLDNTTAQIKPPKGSETYQIAGNATVNCNWTGSSNESAEKSLNVQILPATTTASQTTDGGMAVQQSILCAITVAGLLITDIRTMWVFTDG
ncbi:hypothetical protein CRM22_006843 [Opisthorchis felineus]|uniref:Uncharacterized protein n=1 Tax=Opisthorchis felineus TaxID=147828 RepID=A0A4S2LJ06_OPIFE|nr:hypothetical protein CRM22_006843 [Opisthorchis felineus]